MAIKFSAVNYFYGEIGNNPLFKGVEKYMKKLIFTIIFGAVFLCMAAAERASWRGSMTPVDTEVRASALPDSLKPIGIVHVARHGARYITALSKVEDVRKPLLRAAERGTITPAGEKLLALLDEVIRRTDGRWGLLDSLGMAEEKAIAAGMMERFPMTERGEKLVACSTYVPRCIATMYTYMYTVGSRNSHVDIQTAEGHSSDTLLRFFDTDSAYVAFRKHGDWRAVYDEYADWMVPVSVATRMLGDGGDRHEAEKFVMGVYAVLRSLDAMGMAVPDGYLSEFMSDEELEACWRVSNLEHYLVRTHSSISALPAAAALPLLRRIEEDIDSLAAGSDGPRGYFYFGHAETLMPLFSLMSLPGCSAPDVPVKDVWRHWDDSRVVPLGAYLDLEVYRTPSGRTVVSAVLNGRRISPSEGVPETVNWDVLKRVWNVSAERCDG